MRGTRHAAGIREAVRTMRLRGRRLANVRGDICGVGAGRGTGHAAGTAAAVAVQVGQAETMGGEGTRGTAGVHTWMGQTGANCCEGWCRQTWERSLAEAGDDFENGSKFLPLTFGLALTLCGSVMVRGSGCGLTIRGHVKIDVGAQRPHFGNLRLVLLHLASERRASCAALPSATSWAAASAVPSGL